MLRRRRAILTGDTPLSMEGHAAPGSMATDQSDSASSSSLPAAEPEPAPGNRRARLIFWFCGMCRAPFHPVSTACRQHSQLRHWEAQALHSDPQLARYALFKRFTCGPLLHSVRQQLLQVGVLAVQPRVLLRQRRLLRHQSLQLLPHLSVGVGFRTLWFYGASGS